MSKITHRIDHALAFRNCGCSHVDKMRNTTEEAFYRSPRSVEPRERVGAHLTAVGVHQDQGLVVIVDEGLCIRANQGRISF